MLLKTLCTLTLSACFYLCRREYLTAVGELISISICPNSSDYHFKDEMSRRIFLTVYGFSHQQWILLVRTIKSDNREEMYDWLPIRNNWFSSVLQKLIAVAPISAANPKSNSPLTQAILEQGFGWWEI